ncbi:hypothetical protein [Streptomyces capoamus]|uniref:hypothetical protein n=1 Tax=Streptomyces capoamus TaxID=68183 RepID=UPI003392570A
MSPHDIEERLVGVAYAYALLSAAASGLVVGLVIYREIVRRWHDRGQARLREEVDAHLEQVIADDPQLSAGLDRLLNDVRKGDQP